MKTRVEVRCCNKDTFASEEEARQRLERIQERGVRRVLPMDVEPCMRGWHLTFPPAETEARPRKPLKRSRMKPSKQVAVPDEVKQIIRERSGNLCEVGLSCGGRDRGEDPAHREGKGSGGTDKAWSNLASNVLWSCRACHDLIDNKQPARAERLGLKMRAGVARPREMPVLHKHLGWVLLDHDGGLRRPPAASHPDGKRPTPVIACTTWELINGSGAFIEAMTRFGHQHCRIQSAPREGRFDCSCGSRPFYLQRVA